MSDVINSQHVREGCVCYNESRVERFNFDVRRYSSVFKLKIIPSFLKKKHDLLLLYDNNGACHTPNYCTAPYREHE